MVQEKENHLKDLLLNIFYLFKFMESFVNFCYTMSVFIELDMNKILIDNICISFLYT